MTRDLDRARALHERLDLPEGWKSEIIEGDIHLSLRPGPEHADIVAMLGVQLGRRIGRREWAILPGVEIEHSDMNGLYSPDLLVTRRPYTYTDGERVLDAATMALVVEVTSPSSGDHDRGPKLRGYARSSVPLYLLIDRQNETVHLYSDPDGETYSTRTHVPFGGHLHLPAPFDLTLDTADFE